MNFTSLLHRFAAVVVAAALLSVLTLATASTATAAVPGMSGMLACLSAFGLGSSGPQAASCNFDSDCAGGNLCVDGHCRRPEDVDASDREDWSHIPRTGEGPGLAERLPDDGGADEVCGLDRRCRIERIKERNRLRRHYEAVEHEQLVYDEVGQVLEERVERLVRDRRPWSIAYQYHPLGHGVMVGRTFSGHFRAEASLVGSFPYINYEPEDTNLPTLSGEHSGRYTTAHFTYLPAQGWFSPLLSAGFGMGRGSFGGNSGPETRYHYLTAALGAEAQFDSGFMFRAAYRHGRLLYNQARHGPGNYEPQTRDALREYMHNEGLAGIDISIGWAF